MRAMPSDSRPRLWVSFFAENAAFSSDSADGSRRERYRVDEIRPQRGQPLVWLEPGMTLVRSESSTGFALAEAALSGTVQHVGYTTSTQKSELEAISATESGPLAVLIPIAKSARWWSLAQDEREAYFFGRARGRGHLGIGASYAARIFRRLYHARFVPGSAWDFLTYFEFPAEQTGAFETLLRELRDARLNPEWEFVEREVEIWMTKIA